MLFWLMSEAVLPDIAEHLILPPTHDFETEFAEANAKESLPALPSKARDIWTVFPYAFSGIGRITSRVNYIVSRHSPLVARDRLDVRFITFADLTRKLRERGCRFVRHGKGSHELWESATGTRFPIPRHPGDLRKGTLAAIVKQAGLNTSLEEFLRASLSKSVRPHDELNVAAP